MSPLRFVAPPMTSKGRCGRRFLARWPRSPTAATPQILPDLKNHSKSHVVEIARLFEGGEPGDLAFVRAHARRRAEQRFPLEATLHAYRCGHRVISRWLRDAISPEVAMPSQ
jgi:hypothetical protein